MASKEKWTPGPWTYANSDVRDAGGDLVVSLVFETTEPDDICDANARLIAAAPALVEALERLLACASDIGGPCMGCIDRAHAALAAVSGSPLV